MKKEPENDLDFIAQVAKDTALQYGGHVASVFVKSVEGLAVTQLTDLPSSHEGRAQAMFQAGFALGAEGKMGIPLQVFFITEGWLSIKQPGEDLELRPSQDPKRLEVLLIAGLEILTKTHSLIILEMIRQDEKLVDLQEHSRQIGGQVHSPLVEAFVAGCLMGMSKSNTPRL
jgi:hypothetical protein